MMSVFGENLKKYRIKAGYKSARAFAEDLGIGTTQYRNYEIKGSEPKFDTLIKIADKLGITVDTLLGHTAAFPEDDWLLTIQKALKDRDLEIVDQSETDIIIRIPALNLTSSIPKNILENILQTAREHAVDDQIYNDILRELKDTILAYALTTKMESLPPKAKETLEKFGYVNSK